MNGYDITDFDTLSYSGCKCGGTCSGCSGSTLGYDGGCGCNSNYMGFDSDDFLGLSIRQAPEQVSEGDPVEVETPVVTTMQPVPNRTKLMGVDKKHIKLAALAVGGFLAYKYLIKKK